MSFADRKNYRGEVKNSQEKYTYSFKITRISWFPGELKPFITIWANSLFLRYCKPAMRAGSGVYSPKWSAASDAGAFAHRVGSLTIVTCNPF